MRLKPTAGNVFILPDVEPETIGRIIKPETHRNRDISCTGLVYAMGGKRILKNGTTLEPYFKIGDHVLIKKFSALIMEIGGIKLLQIKHHDVLAGLEKGAYISDGAGNLVSTHLKKLPTSAR